MNESNKKNNQQQLQQTQGNQLTKAGAERTKQNKTQKQNHLEFSVVFLDAHDTHD